MRQKCQTSMFRKESEKGGRDMAAFKRETELQRIALQNLTDAVRLYLQLVEKPTGGRHRKTTMTFVGDRYKPTDILCRFVAPLNQDL